MDRDRIDLKALVNARMDEANPGAVWTPGDFLDLGGREAVDKTLQRLVKAGAVRRIDRGLYDRPAFNSLTQQPNPADTRSIIDAVARRDQIRVLVDGMTAANDLGLTTAVPAKIIVHADARLRPIRLGALDITFRPTAASKLFWAGRPAMRIVQALHWLREIADTPEEDSRLRHQLQRLLNDPASGAVLRADLIDGLSSLPAWMQGLLRPLLSAGGDAAAETSP
jgi:hypothetical protein